MENSDKPILVVDDDPFILDLATRYFMEKGFRVITTTDPESAGALVEHERLRLIISDLGMPGVDGFALIKGFRTNPHTKDVPLVLLTGSDSIIDIEKGFASGAQAYLLKPVDWDMAWPKIEPLLKD